MAPRSRVQNPVWRLPVDNNGVIIQLPAVPAGGALLATGTVTFGIGTEPNNGANSQTVYEDGSSGNFISAFNNNTYPASFLDTGSNALFFFDSSILIRVGGFYCPFSTILFSAANTGINGSSGTVQFQVANAKTLFARSNFAFDGLGAQNNKELDFELSFFFGRTVCVGMDGQPTPVGPGPFWAY